MFSSKNFRVSPLTFRSFTQGMMWDCICQFFYMGSQLSHGRTFSQRLTMILMSYIKFHIYCGLFLHSLTCSTDMFAPCQYYTFSLLWLSSRSRYLIGWVSLPCCSELPQSFFAFYSSIYILESYFHFAFLKQKQNKTLLGVLLELY